MRRAFALALLATLAGCAAAPAPFDRSLESTPWVGKISSETPAKSADHYSIDLSFVLLTLDQADTLFGDEWPDWWLSTITRDIGRQAEKAAASRKIGDYTWVRRAIACAPTTAITFRVDRKLRYAKDWGENGSGVDRRDEGDLAVE